MELPIPEEIYDLDTLSLRELVNNLQENITKFEAIENKQPHDLQFLKKAKKLFGMAELELDERGTVEKFGEFCIANEDNFLSYFEQNLNPYVNSSSRPADDGPKRLDRSPMQKKSNVQYDADESQNLQYHEESDGQSRKNQETVSTAGGNRNMSFSQFSTNSAV
jgi:hypothetical protein